jgi:hypothetical protein
LSDGVAGRGLTHKIHGLPSRGRLLGLSDICGRPRCLPSVRAWGSTCPHDLWPQQRRKRHWVASMPARRSTRSLDAARAWTVGAGPASGQRADTAQAPESVITKTGNTHVRRLLVEAAWHHRVRYVVGKTMRDRWELASPAARARGDAGNRRLNARWGTFRGVPANS